MQYNLFLNKEAGIIDDCMVYRKKEEFFGVVNASNKEKVLLWLEASKEPDLDVVDCSKDMALISLQGPCAAEIIGKFFGKRFSELDYMNFIEDEVSNKKFLISRSGYTGEDGFEIYVEPSEAGWFWDSLVDKGKEFGLKPCGLGARDILRIEAGYPLYGHEIDESINPYQACLGWAVKSDKDFIGREKILKIKEESLEKKRIGFIMQERAVPRQGYEVFKGDKFIGTVSSGTFSPNLGACIGMAYLEKKYTEINTEISVKVRSRLYKARIVKFPFLESKTKTGCKAY